MLVPKNSFNIFFRTEFNILYMKTSSSRDYTHTFIMRYLRCDGRLKPSLEGPRSRKRRVLCSVVLPVILSGAALWEDVLRAACIGM